MYIKLDKRTEQLELNLPTYLARYEQEVLAAVIEEFSFEGLNRSVLIAMNSYIRQWFGARGLDLPEGPVETPVNTQVKPESPDSQ